MNEPTDTTQAGAAQMPPPAGCANSVASPAAADHARDAEAGSRFIVDPGTPAAGQLEMMADALEELRAMSRMTHRDVREIHAAVARPSRREDSAGSVVSVRDPVIDLVRAYEEGCAAFEALPRSAFAQEGDHEELWREPEERLWAEATVPVTVDGAMALVRIVHREATMGGDEYAEKLLPLVLAYLEGRAAR